MTQNQEPVFLSIEAFARAQGDLAGALPLQAFERLLGDIDPVRAQNLVQYRARGEWRKDEHGLETVWLHLSVQTTVYQECQRCLHWVELPLDIERSFRFVATEEQAQEEDETCEEDVLVLSREFDLLALVEDEILLDLPLIPKHETCPVSVKLQVADPDFDDAPVPKPSPFAVLQGLGKKAPK